MRRTGRGERNHSALGYPMNRKISSLFVVLALALALNSCSGIKGQVCTVNCGTGGTGSVSLTMAADTLPTNPNILSFTVSISSIVLNPTSGTPHIITLNPARVVDLVRLETDTAFLGTFANITSGTYSTATVVMGLPAQITFLNDTGATISALNGAPLSPTCPNNTICEVTLNLTGSPFVTLSFTVPASGTLGLGFNVDLKNIVSVVAGSLDVNFTSATLLSAFTLPRAGSNLATGQLDLIEDFSGVVTIASSGVTITPATVTGRGPITASTNATMIMDKDPSGALCSNPTAGNIGTCLSNNQAASMDAILKSDGTLTIREIEPLLGTLQDTVEGIVFAIPTSTQFKIVVTDLLPAATNSKIATLHIGDALTVNLPVNPNPFLVDTKGLPVESVAPGTLANFQGGSNTTPMRPGQAVAVHVTTFTAGTPPSSNADTVTLRWSRFTATPATPFAQSTFNLTAFPSIFQASGSALAQDFPGTATTQNVTNFDGIIDASGLNNAKPVAVRALFIENATNTASPAFVAGKVRQH
jgi:hypothetical protein